MLKDLLREATEVRDYGGAQSVGYEPGKAVTLLATARSVSGAFAGVRQAPVPGTTLSTASVVTAPPGARMFLAIGLYGDPGFDLTLPAMKEFVGTGLPQAVAVSTPTPALPAGWGGLVGAIVAIREAQGGEKVVMSQWLLGAGQDAAATPAFAVGQVGAGVLAVLAMPFRMMASLFRRL